MSSSVTSVLGFLFALVALASGVFSAGFSALHFENAVMGNYFPFQFLLFLIAVIFGVLAMVTRGSRSMVIMALVAIVLSILPLGTLFVRALFFDR